MSENLFFNLNFLKVNFSCIMHGPYLKLNMCIGNIAVERTVSQIFYILVHFLYNLENDI